MEYFRDEYLDSLEREDARIAAEAEATAKREGNFANEILDRVQALLTKNADNNDQVSISDINAALNSLRPSPHPNS